MSEKRNDSEAQQERERARERSYTLSVICQREAEKPELRGRCSGGMPTGQKCECECHAAKR